MSYNQFSSSLPSRSSFYQTQSPLLGGSDSINFDSISSDDLVVQEQLVIEQQIRRASRRFSKPFSTSGFETTGGGSSSSSSNSNTENHGEQRHHNHHQHHHQQQMRRSSRRFSKPFSTKSFDFEAAAATAAATATRISDPKKKNGGSGRMAPRASFSTVTSYIADQERIMSEIYRSHGAQNHTKPKKSIFESDNRESDVINREQCESVEPLQVNKSVGGGEGRRKMKRRLTIEQMEKGLFWSE